MRDARAAILLISAIVVLMLFFNNSTSGAGVMSYLENLDSLTVSFNADLYLVAMIGVACLAVFMVRRYVRRLDAECAASEIKYVEAYCPECGSHLFEGEEFCMCCGNLLKTKRSTPFHFTDKVF